jgi:hypothetical protein
MGPRITTTWHHEERVEAVKTLISLGANPNYNNGQNYSFALAHAVESSAVVLRAMLDGGGDPNGRDANGLPIIFLNWHVGYYTDSQYRPRFDGESGSITATRTVVLGFDRSGKVTIRKSTIEFKTENE